MFYSAVFGIVSAMVGAGFASGREIMHFFSRYGLLSWGFGVLAAGIMGGMMKRVMDEAAETGDFLPQGNHQSAGKALLLLLFTASGGAMAAAAGELAALTVPVDHARCWGTLLTLCAGVPAARNPVHALGVIGKILVPLMIAAFFFCFRLPTDQSISVAPSFPCMIIALVQLLGYCGLNVMLSTGVLYRAGLRRESRERKRLAVGAAAVIGALLLLGNAALLPHIRELEDAPLPFVLLLRAYGKTGFYLSALVLYLAVFSTLAAILCALRGMLPWKSKIPGLWAGLLCAASSLLGFEEIVGLAYPILGWLGILLIFGKKFLKPGTIRRFASSIGRTPNKEEDHP